MFYAYPGPAQTLPPSRSRGMTKLKGPHTVVSELFIYTPIGCSCFTV